MLQRCGVLRSLLLVAGFLHLAIGLAGVGFPRWFFQAAPPWPPMHIGQIQIAGVFDLALAALFLGTARHLERYLPLAVAVGIVAEWGHALVRIGHIVTGSNPTSDVLLPLLMLAFGAVLAFAGFRTRAVGPRQAAF